MTGLFLLGVLAWAAAGRAEPLRIVRVLEATVAIADSGGAGLSPYDQLEVARGVGAERMLVAKLLVQRVVREGIVARIVYRRPDTAIETTDRLERVAAAVAPDSVRVTVPPRITPAAADAPPAAGAPVPASSMPGPEHRVLRARPIWKYGIYGLAGISFTSATAYHFLRGYHRDLRNTATTPARRAADEASRAQDVERRNTFLIAGGGLVVLGIVFDRLLPHDHILSATAGPLPGSAVPGASGLHFHMRF